MIRVLLADDEGMIRSALAALLRLEEDIDVVAECTDGAHALAEAVRLKPDVCLLDLEMPHLDGVEVAERLSRTVATRCVIVTRHARPGVLRRALASGVAGFLPKSRGADEVAAVSGEAGERPQQRAGVRVLGVAVEILGGVELDHAAGAHHGDAVGDLQQQRQVVGDEDHGEAEFVAQVGDLTQDVALHQHVEGRRGLVHDHQLRTQRQGHRDHDALAHAARELVGVGAQAVAADADHVEQVAALAGALGAAHLGAVGDEDVGELLADRHDGVQGVHRALEDHGCLRPAERAHLAVRELADGDARAVGVVEDDGSAGDDGRRLQQPLHAVGEGGLAAAGLAGQAQDLAAADLEGDVADGRDRRVHVVGDAEVGDLQQNVIGHANGFQRVRRHPGRWGERPGCRGLVGQLAGFS